MYIIPHSIAVQAIIGLHGLKWKVVGHADKVEVTLPSKLCSTTGPLGGKIRWNRDQRIPAARFWPGGRLPAGVEALPKAERYTGPMGNEHPSLVMVRQAVADQRNVNLKWQAAERKRIREAKAAVATERAEFIYTRESNERITVGRSVIVLHWQTKHANALRWSLAKETLMNAAKCRQNMAAELTIWRHRQVAAAA